MRICYCARNRLSFKSNVNWQSCAFNSSAVKPVQLATVFIVFRPCFTFLKKAVLALFTSAYIFQPQKAIQPTERLHTVWQKYSKALRQF